MFGVNGTAVQQGITSGPYSINFDGYSFGGAGGWALQRAVTRLKVHGLRLRRQSNAISLRCTRCGWSTRVMPRSSGQEGVRRRLRRARPPSAATRNRYRQPDRA